ncbi:hypothetical protein HT031_001861 [Scenedesmus sp. PABB004]|nr:hypothetical protein HT031_001861 [Scenedesmus sp. PABB004]
MEPLSLEPPPDAVLSGACLARDSFRLAKRRRAEGAGERALVLSNVRILDVRAGQLSSLRHVVVQRGKIVSIDCPLPPPGAVVVACGGRTLMPGAAARPAAAAPGRRGARPARAAVVRGAAAAAPLTAPRAAGLCDAHVHVTATTADLAGLYGLSESLVTARSVDILEGMLRRGFTTVRDAGGADWGLAQAVEEGTLLGPRILFSGHALSQTGGHGDFRSRGEEVCACGAALRGIGRVCDGVDACRAAARDELRKGAHFIKVMASGGVASPTDRLTNTQFSLEELTAICEEAAAAGTYVAAHAYTPKAIARALAAGARSIEHGNWLDADTAATMANCGAWLVPTTVTYAALAREGEAGGMPAALVAKVGAAVEQGQRSMALARDAGVRMAFGSDLLGAMHRCQSEEFLLRSAAGIPAPELVAAATLNCAQLFMQEGVLGEVVPGAAADLVLVEGDPLADIACLVGGGDGEGIRLVVKDGLLAKQLRAARDEGFLGLPAARRRRHRAAGYRRVRRHRAAAMPAAAAGAARRGIMPCGGVAAVRGLLLAGLVAAAAAAAAPEEQLGRPAERLLRAALGEPVPTPWGPVAAVVLCLLPILLLIAVTVVKQILLPTSVSLPLAAALLAFIRLAYLSSDPVEVAACLLAGLLEALTPLSIIAGAILLFQTMHETMCLPWMMGQIKSLSAGHPVAEVMLIGFCFAYLVEGASGFGTPVALAAPMLASLGHAPIPTVCSLLIFNTLATQFGAVGTPIWFGFGDLQLSDANLQLTGLKASILVGACALVIVPLAASFLVPLRELARNGVFVLLSIASAVAPALAISLFSYEFPSLIGGLASVLLTGVLVRFRVGLRPVDPLAAKAAAAADGEAAGAADASRHSKRAELRAASSARSRAASALSAASLCSTTAPSFSFVDGVGAVPHPPVATLAFPLTNAPASYPVRRCFASQVDGDALDEEVAAAAAGALDRHHHDHHHHDGAPAKDVEAGGAPPAGGRDGDGGGGPDAPRRRKAGADGGAPGAAEPPPAGLRASSCGGMSLDPLDPAVAVSPRMRPRDLMLRTLPLWLTVLLLLLTRIPALPIKRTLQSINPSFALRLGNFGVFGISASLVVQLRQILTSQVSWKYELLYVPFLLPFVLASLVTMAVHRRDMQVKWTAPFREAFQRVGGIAVATLGALVLVQLIRVGGAASPAYYIGFYLATWLGKGFLAIAAFLGALGSFFSGSTTVSNLTFGGISAIAGERLGMPVTSMLAVQTAGATLGNMLCINNILSAKAVMNMAGVGEGLFIRATAPAALLFAVLAQALGLAFTLGGALPDAPQALVQAVEGLRALRARASPVRRSATASPVAAAFAAAPPRPCGRSAAMRPTGARSATMVVVLSAAAILLFSGTTAATPATESGFHCDGQTTAFCDLLQKNEESTSAVTTGDGYVFTMNARLTRRAELSRCRQGQAGSCELWKKMPSNAGGPMAVLRYGLAIVTSGNGMLSCDTTQPDRCTLINTAASGTTFKTLLIDTANNHIYAGLSDGVIWMCDATPTVDSCITLDRAGAAVLSLALGHGVLWAGLEGGTIWKCLPDEVDRCRAWDEAGSDVNALVLADGFLFAGLNEGTLWRCELGRPDACSPWARPRMGAVTALVKGEGATVLVGAAGGVRSCATTAKNDCARVVTLSSPMSLPSTTSIASLDLAVTDQGVSLYVAHNVEWSDADSFYYTFGFVSWAVLSICADQTIVAIDVVRSAAPRRSPTAAGLGAPAGRRPPPAHPRPLRLARAWQAAPTVPSGPLKLSAGSSTASMSGSLANESNLRQTSTFSMTATRAVQVGVQWQEAVKRAWKVDLKFKIKVPLPVTPEITGGYQGEVTITNTKSETFTDTASNAYTAPLAVDPHQNCSVVGEGSTFVLSFSQEYLVNITYACGKKTQERWTADLVTTGTMTTQSQYSLRYLPCTVIPTPPITDTCGSNPGCMKHKELNNTKCCPRADGTYLACCAQAAAHTPTPCVEGTDFDFPTQTICPNTDWSYSPCCPSATRLPAPAVTAVWFARPPPNATFAECGASASDVGAAGAGDMRVCVRVGPVPSGGVVPPGAGGRFVSDVAIVAGREPFAQLQCPPGFDKVPTDISRTARRVALCLRHAPAGAPVSSLVSSLLVERGACAAKGHLVPPGLKRVPGNLGSVGTPARPLLVCVGGGSGNP